MSKETNDANFKNDVLSSAKPVLVDFWAPWCNPCRMLTPIIDDISKELANKIEVFKVNVDDNPETPSQYMVRGIPALMIFKDGKLVDSKVGSLPKPALIDWINKSIG